MIRLLAALTRWFAKPPHRPVGYAMFVGPCTIDLALFLQAKGFTVPPDHVLIVQTREKVHLWRLTRREAGVWGRSAN